MSEKLTNIIEQLKTLTLLEASELVTEIENVFGVDTSVSVAAAAVAAPAGGGDAGGAEERDEFDITLTTVPADKKIAILKIVRKTYRKLKILSITKTKYKLKNYIS